MPAWWAAPLKSTRGGMVGRKLNGCCCCWLLLTPGWRAVLIRDGPLSPGTLRLYWRLAVSGIGVRSYGMKSKTRVSNSNTGFDRIDVMLLLGVIDSAVVVDGDTVVVVVVVDEDGSPNDDDTLASVASMSVLSSTASSFLLPLPTTATDPALGPEALLAEKATLLKMAPRVLSMELGLSPREKTGRSRSDKLWSSGADVTRCDRRSALPPTVPVCLRCRRRWRLPPRSSRPLLIGRLSLSTYNTLAERWSCCCCWPDCPTWMT